MVEPAPGERALPLFAWFEARRMARVRRARLRRRGVAIAIGSAGLIATIALPPLPRLVWNASASAPIGLYVVTPGAPLARGDMVIAWPPPTARILAASRHYLPRDVPLVKRVAGIPDDQICAENRIVSVNGRAIATRLVTDPRGRPLPWWQGCRRLDQGALFLLMTETPDSFDGRYFGVSQRRDIIGRARPLWTR